MKISRVNILYGKRVEFDTVESAVSDALTPNPWSYDDKEEKIEEEVKLQRNLLAGLMNVLYDKKIIDKNDLVTILNLKYEIEDD